MITTSWMDSDLQLTVTGTAHLLSELGEQIGWLGGAFRSNSESQSGYTTLEPYIELTSLRPSTGVPSFIFGHKAVNISIPQSPPVGQCWFPFFARPTLVMGYPTLRRPNDLFGLEISLHTASQLINAPLITRHGDKISVAGFGAMLLLQKQDRGRGINAWHLIVNSDRSRISYDYARDYGTSFKDYEEAMKFAGFRDSRHIVGWCSTVKSHAGELPRITKCRCRLTIFNRAA
jgi:hypothetical protein